MKWSWKLGKIAGIDVFVHWTFLLLLAFVGLSGWVQTRNVAAAAGGIVFMLALFGCVVLHELGHALTARRFRIATRDITLLPIGGVARLERMPEDPRQELLVALAGPAVNVVIALLLGGVLIAMGRTGEFLEAEVAFFRAEHFVVNLLRINVSLVVFNLLPAFPMDGGRVLRAVLAMRMSYVRATQLAASVGQVMAILFGILGLFTGHILLMFIAFFVYIGAQEEAHMVQMRSIFKGVPVREAMLTSFQALQEHDTLSTVRDVLLAGSQEDFPVVDGERVVGLLSRNDLMRALTEVGLQARVGDVMRRDCQAVDETEMLDAIFTRMQEQSCPLLPVMRGTRLVGLVTLNNVAEWMMVQNALQGKPADGSRTGWGGKSERVV